MPTPVRPRTPRSPATGAPEFVPPEARVHRPAAEPDNTAVSDAALELSISTFLRRGSDEAGRALKLDQLQPTDGGWFGDREGRPMSGDTPTWRTWHETLHVVTIPRHLRSTLTIALIVGTVLFAINQLDVVIEGSATAVTWLKSAPT
jgi:hypothetical protein